MDRGRLEAIKPPSIIISVTKTCHLVKNLHHFKQFESSEGRLIDGGSWAFLAPGRTRRLPRSNQETPPFHLLLGPLNREKNSISATYCHGIDKN